MENTDSLENKLDALLHRRNWNIVLLCLFGSLFAMFETMAVDSAFAYGRPAMAPLVGAIVALTLLGITCSLTLSKATRHRYISRCAVGTTLFAIFALFLLSNAIAQAQLKNPTQEVAKLAFTPTLIVLGVQLAAALVYLSYAHPLPPADEPRVVKPQSEPDSHP